MNDAALGRINKILPTSFVDGPGNRTVVFLQGCNFNCLYCHNPYTINLCIHCGICVEHCPEQALEMIEGKVVWYPEKCVDCDTCIAVCPHSSSPKVEQLSASAVWDRIKPNAVFLRGITASGGEPLLQAPFIIELFKHVHQQSNLTTYIETNGHASDSVFTEVLQHTDMVQVDLKCADPEKHKQLTGMPWEKTLASIRTTYQAGKLYAVQQVIAADYTLSSDQIRKTAKIISSIDPAIKLRLVRFRPHGTRGEAMHWLIPEDNLMEDLRAEALEAGLVHVENSL